MRGILRAAVACGATQDPRLHRTTPTSGARASSCCSYATSCSVRVPVTGTAACLQYHCSLHAARCCRDLQPERTTALTNLRRTTAACERARCCHGHCGLGTAAWGMTCGAQAAANHCLRHTLRRACTKARACPSQSQACPQVATIAPSTDGSWQQRTAKCSSAAWEQPARRTERHSARQH